MMMSPTLANEAINAISVRFESIMTFQNLSHLLYFMINTDMPIEFLVLINTYIAEQAAGVFCKLIALHLAPNLKRMIPAWRGEETFFLKNLQHFVCNSSNSMNRPVFMNCTCSLQCVETIFSASMKEFS